ncbi:hypothetical protein [Mycolicibacterium fortuitum]|uniref:hypothetical protein n=1 Tax=Mycolicibacterium fortuitum TaxID=1766 RepID=UPI000B1512D2
MRFHIVAAIAVGVTVFSPLPPAQAWPWPPPPGIEDINGYPIAEGDYSSPTDHYGLFFRTPDGRHCGIRPNRGPVGCDAVPADAPEGMNQTFVEAGAPATYRYSGTRRSPVMTSTCCPRAIGWRTGKPPALSPRRAQ